MRCLWALWRSFSAWSLASILDSGAEKSGYYGTFVEDRLASVSYNRLAGSPSSGRRVTEAQIRADLTAIAAHARAVRTYASTQGLERVPEIAAELGLK